MSAAFLEVDTALISTHATLQSCSSRQLLNAPTSCRPKHQPAPISKMLDNKEFYNGYMDTWELLDAPALWQHA